MKTNMVMAYALLPPDDLNLPNEIDLSQPKLPEPEIEDVQLKDCEFYKGFIDSLLESIFNKNENKLHAFITELRKRIDKEEAFTQTDKRIIDSLILDSLTTMEK